MFQKWPMKLLYRILPTHRPRWARYSVSGWPRSEIFPTHRPRWARYSVSGWPRPRILPTHRPRWERYSVSGWPRPKILPTHQPRWARYSDVSVGWQRPGIHRCQNPWFAHILLLAASPLNQWCVVRGIVGRWCMCTDLQSASACPGLVTRIPENTGIYKNIACYTIWNTASNEAIFQQQSVHSLCTHLQNERMSFILFIGCLIAYFFGCNIRLSQRKFPELRYVTVFFI